jgi:acyl-CoA thioesterase-1
MLLATPAFADDAPPLRLLALGDSLVASYRVNPEEGFAQQLEKALRARGYNVEVIDAGIAGDTTQGGLSRLEWLVDDTVDVALVALGANDLLRGLPAHDAKANLDAILRFFGEKTIPVLLAGMKAGANVDEEYRLIFNSMYADLAMKHNALLYPFFLEGVAGKPELNQYDGMHPNAQGVRVMVANILPYVEQLIALHRAP